MPDLIPTPRKTYVLSRFDFLRPDLPWVTRAALVDASGDLVALDSRSGLDSATAVLAPLVGWLNARQFAYLLAGDLSPTEETLVVVDLDAAGLVADSAPDSAPAQKARRFPKIKLSRPTRDSGGCSFRNWGEGCVLDAGHAGDHQPRNGAFPALP